MNDDLALCFITQSASNQLALRHAAVNQQDPL